MAILRQNSGGVFLIILALFFFAFLLTAPVFAETPAVDELELLKSRQETLFRAFIARDFETIWDMLASSLQSDNKPKESFVRDMNAFFGKEPFSYQYESAEVFEPGYLAKTHTVLTLPWKDPATGESVSLCRGVVWLWENATWKVVFEYDCEHEQDMFDSLKQWKRPTKNLFRVPSGQVVRP